MQTLTDLPKDLPKPQDDGACDHLTNTKFPSIGLATTEGLKIDFSSVNDRLVIYLYPMTGQPDTPLPEGWDQIPGARGCTPQSCSFRDHYSELKQLNTAVYGLSTQPTEYQQEAAKRLHLPFPLVSDKNLEFIKSLNIPTIEVDGMVLSKRVTLVANNGVIEKVFYPVFPADQNANQVMAYLKQKKG